MKRLGITFGIMGQIIARLIAWLAGKVVIYAVILGILLAIFVIKVVPPMVVRYHKKELEKAIAELSESKVLVGEIAEKAKGIGGEIDVLMRNEFRQLALNALLILAALILIPFLWKLAAYYVIAPIAESSEPILLGSEVPGGQGITATPSYPAQRIHLGEGEVLMTKVDYLQGSMGGFDKRTKWLMDWRYPFSSAAAGLFMLTQIRNTAGGGAGQVTLSTREDATEELSVVEIPAGKSMVFRPHYLVVVSHPVGTPPRIRSRWVFGKLHAWVNLRFRYLIIEGPAKLVFSAQRGIQVEEVLPELPGRRVNSHLTAAFSPHLSHSPKRAETFVAYLRGKNALFDDFFRGSGHVIQQQVTGTKRNPIARIWESVFGAIGKVFGI